MASRDAYGRFGRIFPTGREDVRYLRIAAICELCEELGL